MVINMRRRTLDPVSSHEVSLSSAQDSHYLAHKGHPRRHRPAR
ncbi:hypothetical protein EDWATA_02039 [Edwardsiella tarda ATCC 23685]|uniref:Uncharacterized protein n=1 Tax=Edwardsiella tarda ATCC 23685 TaxID=500638 RepID=D4F5L1_EDWTA|nr:hypothetical protein EDWATA_02039 [Edwardsiella tarda ATCC 23685]